MAFYTSYLHPLLRSDPYFAARGLVPEKFLDCVAGHTARAVGVAKTGSAGSKHPRYSRLQTPMALSSPMALRVYRHNPVYFTGRMLGLFVDTPISTFTCEGRGDDVRHLMRLSDIVARASELVYPALSSTGGPERSLPRDTATQRERTRQVRDDVVDRMQVDTRRLRVNMHETGAVVASVLVYQRVDCNFCPIRDCTIVHSDAQRRVPLRAVYDGTRTGRAEDGRRRGDAAKMHIVYQLLPRFPTVIRHYCWKCKSTGDAASKHGVVVGVMTPRMTADVLNAVANCEQTECFAKNADLEIEVQTCASNLQLSKATNALLDRRLESTVDARDRLQREYYLQTRKVQTLSDELSTLAHSHHPALYRKMHLGALAAPASVHLFFAPRIVAVDEGGNGVATYVDRSDARSGREFVCDTQSDLGECVAAYAAQIYKQDGAKRPTIDRLADSRHVVLVARAPRYAVLLAPSCTASAADVLKRLSPEDRNINDAADDGRYAPWSRACSEMWTRRYQVFERKHLPSDVRTALAVLFS
ncbi:hypothetical protein CYMTET_34290 [Cymbomonas tetramitiformis]|uniref:Uncharacterized protein n=1 Tax=Cymbomonas tetramitiformis TaxID=36881 RepID=A0AAE0KQC8_9CHLO|nr:hypothetical protein CYMTET_34290 [Cymbomonas tetramitiformis]